MTVDRREAIAVIGGIALAAAEARASRAELPSFWKSRLTDVDEAVKRVKYGTARVLARSAGQRPLYLVTYGARQDRKGLANYNSACGGNDPASYASKDGTQRPVVFLLGPVHGGEFEGIVGLVNLLHVADSRADPRPPASALR
jgi:hypothetical protein